MFVAGEYLALLLPQTPPPLLDPGLWEGGYVVVDLHQ